MKVSPFWPPTRSTLCWTSEFKFSENPHLARGPRWEERVAEEQRSSTPFIPHCVWGVCTTLNYHRRASDINYVQRGVAHWSSCFTERVGSRDLGLHFGDKCSWEEGYKQNCNNKTFNESEKGGKCPIYSKAKAKRKRHWAWQRIFIGL